MEFTSLTRVKVESAPGYKDFEGTLLLAAEGMDSRGDLAIIASDGEQHVIPTRYIKEA